MGCGGVGVTDELSGVDEWTMEDGGGILCQIHGG